MEYRVHVSGINLWFECPQKWYYVEALFRTQRESSVAMKLGTLVHADIELVSKDSKPIPIESRYQHAVTAGAMDWDLKVFALCKSMTERLAFYYTNFHPKSLIPEMQMEKRIGKILGSYPDADVDIILVGRLDALEEYENRLWHRQYKTRANSGNQATYSNLKQISLHEAAYAELINSTVPNRTYGGTILVTIVKSSPTKRENGKTGPLIPRPVEETVFVEHLPISEEKVSRAIEDIKFVAKAQYELLSHISGCTPTFPLAFPDAHVPRNRDACGGRHGNSKCEFFQTCWGQVPISDETFYKDRNPLEAYAANAAETDEEEES